MIIALLITLAALSCASAWLIVNRAGEEENICKYDYIEK